MKTYRIYVTDPEGGVIPFGYPQADIYCEAVNTVHCDRYGSEGIAVTRRRNGEGVVMGVRGKQIDRLMVPRRQWTGFVVVAFLFACLSGLNASLTLAADLAKGGAVAEPESLLDTIFGPPDNCLPKKPFYYDVRAKQSRYGDEIGVLEKLGAVGEQMKDFPEFYEFKTDKKFRGIDVKKIYIPNCIPLNKKYCNIAYFVEFIEIGTVENMTKISNKLDYFKTLHPNFYLDWNSNYNKNNLLNENDRIFETGLGRGFTDNITYSCSSGGKD